MPNNSRRKNSVFKEKINRKIAFYSYIEGKAVRISIQNPIFKLLSKVKHRYISKKPFLTNIYKSATKKFCEQQLNQMIINAKNSKNPLVMREAAERKNSKISTVSFEAGWERRKIIYRALDHFRKEIKNDIKNKQVIIKVNMTHPTHHLSTTHVDAARAILDFFKGIYKKPIIIAESGNQLCKRPLEALKNFNYNPLLRQYNVKFLDLNERPAKEVILGGVDKKSLKVHVINDFLNPNNYIVSVTRLKTHNGLLATLSLKNIVMAAPVMCYKQKNQKNVNEKLKMHSRGIKAINYYLFELALRGVVPDLAVLDGVVGMEGEGPVHGTPVRHGVAIASTGWLAADRLAVELMGINYEDVIYLRLCGYAGLGQDDLSKIKIIGSNYLKYIRKYKLSQNDWAFK